MPLTTAERLAALESRYRAERGELEREIEAERREEYQKQLMTLSPARRKARAIIGQLCDDPEMWGTHGMPGAVKLARLEDEFTRAFEESPCP